MRKKIVSLILCVCMLGCLLSVSAVSTAQESVSSKTECCRLFSVNLRDLFDKIFEKLSVVFGCARSDEADNPDNPDSLENPDNLENQENAKETVPSETPCEKEEEKAKEDPKGQEKDRQQEDKQQEDKRQEEKPQQDQKQEDQSQKDQQQEDQKQNDRQQGSATGITAYELEVIRLVNIERAKYGLRELTYSKELSDGARMKSADMQKLGYFSHTSPTYGSPFDQMRSLGISYRSAGENIAMGYSTPEAVVNAWMNSEGHRANILSAKYTEIGVGYVQNGNYCTQWFRG